MNNEYFTTKKRRVSSVDVVADGVGSSGDGRSFGVSRQDQPRTERHKGKGSYTMSERTNQSRNVLPNGTNRTLQRGTGVQGGNLQTVGSATADYQTPQTVRLFTWQGISETLLLLWLFFLMMTTRATGCGHVASAYDVDTTAIAEIPEVASLRQAIDSGRDELRTASERFNKAALSIPANEKIRLELPYYFRDSTGN